MSKRGRPVVPGSMQQRARTMIPKSGMTPRELAGALGTSHGYARLIINRLVDKGIAQWSGPRRHGAAYKEERRAFVTNYLYSV